MRKKINNYVLDWERKGYFNGIPDEAPARLEALNKVPSYRMICKAILKNDISLKTLGLIQIKPPSYHEFKKIELGIKPSNQLKLKL